LGTELQQQHLPQKTQGERVEGGIALLRPLQGALDVAPVLRRHFEAADVCAVNIQAGGDFQ